MEELAALELPVLLYSYRFLLDCWCLLDAHICGQYSMDSMAWLVLSVLGKHPSNMLEKGELSEQGAGSSKLLEQP